MPSWHFVFNHHHKSVGPALVLTYPLEAVGPAEQSCMVVLHKSMQCLPRILRTVEIRASGEGSLDDANALEMGRKEERPELRATSLCCFQTCISKCNVCQYVRNKHILQTRITWKHWIESWDWVLFSAKCTLTNLDLVGLKNVCRWVCTWPSAMDFPGSNLDKFTLTSQAGLRKASGFQLLIGSTGIMILVYSASLLSMQRQQTCELGHAEYIFRKYGQPTTYVQ